MELSSSTNRKGRIAVIDDDAVFVDLMHDLLAVGEGYDVISAPHWRQSVEFVKDAQPDLIILDLVLGRDETGWRVLELLRQDPRIARIPVIVCSAAEPALRECSEPHRGHGALEAVAKPFDVDDLIAVVQRLLRTASKPVACARICP
jgi:CheY-like chemotaxis protein